MKKFFIIVFILLTIPVVVEAQSEKLDFQSKYIISDTVQLSVNDDYDTVSWTINNNYISSEKTIHYSVKNDTFTVSLSVKTKDGNYKKKTKILDLSVLISKKAKNHDGRERVQRGRTRR
jgi:regulatory protein YycI of two-component signal transduction system YycFG